MTSTPFTPNDRAALADLWQQLQNHDQAMRAEFMRELEKIPSMASLLRNTAPAQLEEQEKVSKRISRAALLDGDWEQFAHHQRQQGAMYASIAVPFADWFEVVAAFQKSMLPLLVRELGKEPERLAGVLVALSRYVDYAMALIGDEYLKTKERIILQQQEAIQELSTPVLQIRDQLLLVPIIGVLDTSRARLLTQQLLGAIRTHRARFVVIDITGVAAVDSKVANHLFQTVAAVKLMGARSIITGLSADVAEALVGLGVDVSRINTVTDLQSGMEEVNRLMGVRLVKEAGR